MKPKYLIPALLFVSLAVNLFAHRPSLGVTKPDTAKTKQLASPLSQIQQKFLTREGTPDLFAVTFTLPEPQTSNAIHRARKARRLDTWIYFGEPTRIVYFDKGFYIDQEEVAAIDRTHKTALKPADFAMGLHKNDITRRFGTPDQQQSSNVQGQAVSIFRYEAKDSEPPKSFGFIGDILVAINIGSPLKS